MKKNIIFNTLIFLISIPVSAFAQESERDYVAEVLRSIYRHTLEIQHINDVIEEIAQLRREETIIHYEAVQEINGRYEELITTLREERPSPLDPIVPDPAIALSEEEAQSISVQILEVRQEIEHLGQQLLISNEDLDAIMRELSGLEARRDILTESIESRNEAILFLDGMLNNEFNLYEVSSNPLTRDILSNARGFRVLQEAMAQEIEQEVNSSGAIVNIFSREILVPQGESWIIFFDRRNPQVFTNLGALGDLLVSDVYYIRVDVGENVEFSEPMRTPQIGRGANIWNIDPESEYNQCINGASGFETSSVENWISEICRATFPDSALYPVNVREGIFYGFNEVIIGFGSQSFARNIGEILDNHNDRITLLARGEAPEILLDFLRDRLQEIISITSEASSNSEEELSAVEESIGYLNLDIHNISGVVEELREEIETLETVSAELVQSLEDINSNEEILRLQAEFESQQELAEVRYEGELAWWSRQILELEAAHLSELNIENSRSNDRLMEINEPLDELRRRNRSERMLRQDQVQALDFALGDYLNYLEQSIVDEMLDVHVYFTEGVSPFHNNICYRFEVNSGDADDSYEMYYLTYPRFTSIFANGSPIPFVVDLLNYDLSFQANDAPYLNDYNERVLGITAGSIIESCEYYDPTSGDRARFFESIGAYSVESGFNFSQGVEATVDIHLSLASDIRQREGGDPGYDYSYIHVAATLRNLFDAEVTEIFDEIAQEFPGVEFDFFGGTEVSD